MAQFDLKAVITAEDKASKKIKSVGSTFASLAKVGIGAAVAGVGALTYGLKKCVDAAMENQKVVAQTNAVLKSTGGIAGVTADEVSNLATKYQNLTGMSDEVIQSGENMLLTFTKIGKDVFPEATETMLDMSVALGQDVKSSAIQLGKALQDPILGVTALRRVGVNFGEAEKEMIETMVEAGDIMGAQKFILQELRKEFGGSARAAGETFPGKLNILKENLGDLQEQIGLVVIDALMPFVQQLTEIAKRKETIITIQNLALAITRLITQIATAVKWLYTHRTATYAIIAVLGVLIAVIGVLTGSALAILIGSILYVTTIIKLWQRALNWVIVAYNNLVAAIRRGIEAFKNTSFVQVQVNAFMSLVNILRMVYDWLVKVKNTISNISLGGILGSAKNAVKGILGFQTGGIMPHDGIAYLHKGEKVTASPFVTNNDNGVTINFYGNISNTSNASLDDIGRRLSRQLELARQGVL